MKPSTTQSKLVTRLSQFNAIVGSLFMLIVLLGILFAVWQIVMEWRKPTTHSNVVNVSDNELTEEKFSIGRSESIAGSNAILLPLYANQSYTLSSYDSSNKSIRNLLFVNTASNSMAWLLPTNDWLIDRYRLIPAAQNSDSTVLAILYELVQVVSNQDERLSKQDRITLAVSKPNGDDFREIIAAIDSILGVHTTDDKVMVFYNRQQKAHLLSLSLPDMRILDDKTIPMILE